MTKTAMWWRSTTLLLAMLLVREVSVHDYDHPYNYRPYIAERYITEQEPYISTVSDEYVRHVHSILGAYGGADAEAGAGGAGGRLLIETNALINTKYRAWKRNADLINSLLALPKGLNDAGR